MNKKRSQKVSDQRQQIKMDHTKRKRKRKLRKYMLYYILLIIIIVSTAISLSMTVFFNINNYRVETTIDYSQQEVIDASKVQLGDNLIRINLGEVEKNILTELLKLDSVKVTREIPNTLAIECKATTYAYSCKQADGTYVYLSEKGRVLSADQAQPKEETMVLSDVNISNANIGEFVDINETSSKTLIDLKDKIDEAGLKDVTSIQIIGEDKVEITYQNRILIKIDNMSQVDYMLESSVKILSEYIGATEQGTIFYDKSTKAIHFLPNHS